MVTTLDRRQGHGAPNGDPAPAEVERDRRGQPIRRRSVAIRHSAATERNMRGIRATLALAAFLAFGGADAAEAPLEPIRFGLTAAVVRENLDLYERWAAYLGRKVGRPVRFVQRRTYREAIGLLQSGENDFSWICSLPFAEYRGSKLFDLMAVPVFEGQPLYRSYIIVGKDSSFHSIDDLTDHVFAYS
ncbi:MAG: PhnD/SsuA/transferrin family substrate-binding protein, partial [Rudaea sp.]|nr:PhnD/SsuA/transferrin family substrate-binding protein [Rudaea sp.]